MRHAAAVLLSAVLIASAVQGDVRPLSDAERAAVQFAADYLQGGAPTLVDKLARSSPLRKLAPADLPLEIETRLGPHVNAQWELVTIVEALKDKAAAFGVSYPSGIDETVFFEMVDEGGAWKIGDIRITAMPTARPPLFAEAAAIPSTPIDAPAVSPDMLAAFAGMLAILLAAAALACMRTNRIAGRLVYLACAFLVAGAAAFALLKGEKFALPRTAAAAVVAADTNQLRLAPLASLRRALAAGGEEATAALAATPPAGVAGDVAKLWRAQWDFNQMKLGDVRKTLDGYPAPSPIPLAEIVRARLALVENRPEIAVVAYQNAINAGPGRDSLWAEMSLALMAGGFDELAKKNLTRLSDLGSREPGVYYAIASLSTTPEELEKSLKKAWELQPIARDELVESGMLWSLVRKRSDAFINLSDPHEPRFASPNSGTRSITLPAGAFARVSGDYLHVSIGESQLSVAGGAALAPAAAVQVGADEWTRLEEERALRDVESLLSAPPTAGSYMQPALRQRITDSAEALANHNRWSDVVTLTGQVSPKSEFVPASLFFLRAEALKRVQKEEEAKRLLVELSASPVLARKRDARSMESLGEMLSSFDEHDRAIRMFERARGARANSYQEMRIAQIAMDQRLAREYQTHKTANFEIHYPEEHPPGLAEKLGRVLEGELARLQMWVPLSKFTPVVVNVVWWRDFRSIYTGSDDVLGFYNGKITVPLAGIGDFSPDVVGLVTHELTHAMIAQATNDQAPRWFHEGLAQRVQMIEYHANAFNMYEDDKLFAVSVLDPVLRSSRDPDMVGAAYIVSQTLIRFIEARYGPGGIRKMLASYASGGTAMDAIPALSGSDVAEFNTAFRQWGQSEKRVFENTIPVRYDTEESDGALRFSKEKRP